MVLGAVVGLVLTGLFIVFAGQMARALFDQANAVRDLVTLERARIGSDCSATLARPGETQRARSSSSTDFLPPPQTSRTGQNGQP